jgi:hypothetical protein
VEFTVVNGGEGRVPGQGDPRREEAVTRRREEPAVIGGEAVEPNVRASRSTTPAGVSGAMGIPSWRMVFHAWRKPDLP